MKNPPGLIQNKDCEHNGCRYFQEMSMCIVAFVSGKTSLVIFTKSEIQRLPLQSFPRTLAGSQIEVTDSL